MFKAPAAALDRNQPQLEEARVNDKRGNRPVSRDSLTFRRVSDLGDAEIAFVARWVALARPEVAEEGLEALAAFRRDYPDKARLMFGAGPGER